MKIAVAGMKHVGHGQAVPLGNAIDRNQNFGQTRARYDRIHRDHVGTDAPHGAECAFPA